MSSPQRERYLELAAERAQVGLDAADDHEFRRLAADLPDAEQVATELELAAAAVALAGIGPLVTLPAGLAGKLERGAPSAKVPNALKSTVPMPGRPTQPPRSIGPGPALYAIPAPRELPKRSGRGFAIAGWIAAAACLLLAAGTWYLRAPVRTPAAEREALLARAGTARFDWTPTKDATSRQATGDVVWSAAEKRGFMRFRGLAKNDHRSFVYQLWIFDKSRDESYPVDGGVFDVDDETGDVIVPIKTQLEVGEVALFAVTVEKPGGVVVSKRERIVVTAKPPT